ncbi:aminotransferase [Leptospira wolffii]|uniref:Aminotransferase n=1 Tax=Leptospira wolffii TaxID=409998 RepID=A0A2M9ZE75_9LEPT|nr:pyridoxal phosphate-dependent aminotransferase [Leptospira wolffii]PJZ66738.1 aminotransferase [Leptospira wolffii]
MRSGEFSRFSDRFEYHPGQNELYKTLEEIKNSSEDWIDLTLSNPTKSGLIYPSEAILHSLSKAESLEYDPDPRGLLSARKAVAEYYREKEILYSPEDLFLTSSSSEAYSYLIKLLCNPKDRVLIPSPGYPLFEFLSLLDGVEFESYSLEENRNWSIDFQDLESKISKNTKIVFVVSPNNPSGSILSPGDFSRLENLAVEKGFSIIIDEVFSDYIHDKKGHIPKTKSSKAPVFVVNGISKILALPQMKLSWIHIDGPDDWKEECKERLEIIADTYLGLSTPIQIALPDLFQWRKMIQSQIQRRIKRNLSFLEESANNENLIRYSPPLAGWYAILRSECFDPDEEICVRLLKEKKVLVHPGSMFGFAEGFGNLVLSLLSEPDPFREGFERILEFAKSIRDRA